MNRIESILGSFQLVAWYKRIQIKTKISHAISKSLVFFRKRITTISLEIQDRLSHLVIQALAGDPSGDYLQDLKRHLNE